jgi:hypothetical protein
MRRAAHGGQNPTQGMGTPTAPVSFEPHQRHRGLHRPGSQSGPRALGRRQLWLFIVAPRIGAGVSAFLFRDKVLSAED